jgi:hypothetical protein
MWLLLNNLLYISVFIVEFYIQDKLIVLIRSMFENREVNTLQICIESYI